MCLSTQVISHYYLLIFIVAMSTQPQVCCTSIQSHAMNFSMAQCQLQDYQLFNLVHHKQCPNCLF